MDKTVSFVEKTRQKIYDDLKKEDIDYVKANSKKLSVDLYRRKKTEDPWLKCFFFRNIESKKSSPGASIFASSKDRRNTSILDDMISNRRRLTEEETMFFKYAMIREAHARKLKNLSSKPDDLRLLFGKYYEELNENFCKMDSLYEEISSSMANFEISVRCLKALEPFSKIAITADTTEDEAVAGIATMKYVMQDLLKYADFAIKNICEAHEGIERVRELDEKVNHNNFNFLAHFLPYFLHPKVKERKYSSPGWLHCWKIENLEENREFANRFQKTAKLPIKTSKRFTLV